MTRRIYVYDASRGIMVDKATREPMNPPNEPWRPTTPQIFGDYEPFESPISGDIIGGRRARRYEMEKHGVVDANDFKSPTGGKLKNKRFAKKHGLEHLLKEGAR